MRAERAARGDTKKKSSAALCIQRHWRGHAARLAMRVRLAAAFLAEFSPMVSAAQQLQQSPAEDVIVRLLPPALFLLSGRTASPSAPLVLSESCSSSGGGGSRPSPTLLQVVRCLLSLLMRSLTSSDKATCCLALGLEVPVCRSTKVGRDLHAHKHHGVGRLLAPFTSCCQMLFLSRLPSSGRPAKRPGCCCCAAA